MHTHVSYRDKTIDMQKTCFVDITCFYNDTINQFFNKHCLDLDP